ncbi:MULTISPECIES: MOSC domain-containing protein [Cupriavidus]|uniref:MOSC domain-containing protein n=1 Tax=Cupriavidus pauculus TaxID=82633 RepID=A0A5P2H508_9BURK|nr:MOSC domain-containing protein [Cupriavidus pauculus]QET03197.1 MOSC domain-containing protein [Cupriavidus pauculus]
MTESARVLAVSVGTALPLVVAGAGTEAIVRSAIRKHPLSTQLRPIAVQVHSLGLAGDEQADRTAHGGPDRAVYLYPFEHYAWWNALRREARVPESNRPLGFGALGENLTVQGLFESELWAGDVLGIGSALLEVALPRLPSAKLNAAMGYGRAVRDMVQSGNTGVYLRVLKPGEIQAGDVISVTPGPRKLSVENINHRRRDGWRVLF